MSKINLKEFKKLVKQYQDAYDTAEVGTLDHALKANDVALLEQISSMITGVDSEKETSEDHKKTTPVKSKDDSTKEHIKQHSEEPKIDKTDD